MNKEIIEFLKGAGTYYLATVDGNSPKVRPFGTFLEYEGKLYIQTGKVKDVSKQLSNNPNAEICAFNGNEWIRISGKLINDDRREVKAAMLDNYPSLKNMYNADDDNTQVLYFVDLKATIYSFTSAPRVLE